jgi:hypothetical protein
LLILLHDSVLATDKLEVPVHLLIVACSLPDASVLIRSLILSQQHLKIIALMPLRDALVHILIHQSISLFDTGLRPNAIALCPPIADPALTPAAPAQPQDY